MCLQKVAKLQAFDLLWPILDDPERMGLQISKANLLNAMRTAALNKDMAGAVRVGDQIHSLRHKQLRHFLMGLPSLVNDQSYPGTAPRVTSRLKHT